MFQSVSHGSLCIPMDSTLTFHSSDVQLALVVITTKADLS